MKADEALSQDESERALGIARLVRQVEKIVGESGDADGFDAAQWTAAWLQQPNPALGGKAPGDFMDTADGRALVSGLIAQIPRRYRVEPTLERRRHAVAHQHRHPSLRSRRGGRWNRVGMPLVYASTSRALACLVTVVHLAADPLPLNRYLVAISVSPL